MQYKQETKNGVTVAAQSYYSERDHFTTANGLIFNSDRLIMRYNLFIMGITGHRCLMRACDHW